MSRQPSLFAASDDKPTARQSKRIARAVEGFHTAAETIGPIEPGMSLFAITRGQISMIDVVRHVISQATGPVRASVWTWCIAEYEVEAFEYFFRESIIEQATLVIDRSAEQRNAELIARWRDRYGRDAVRVCMNHAKISTIECQAFKVLARGSMNLNYNPRFEQFDISEGDGAFDLVREIEEDLPVLPRLSSRKEANDATKLTESFTADQLKPFEGIKPWAK
ncbi:hypothetical protein [Aureliella helgolandensis]|uniref:Phospholipase D-like domain-containing protein n=1 Tax=Aureliella helgolandensis TaxID=2527968 RepID=A0A518G714_9BACT|nr:hypothetical protein [Aureliella helgolandensis]QDV24379.1 hypothetical protein Q31a_26960 [Aureliella helgolandensis]